MKLPARWSTPNGMMSLVFVMYLIKVIAKLSIGYLVHSPMITGDGSHNAADLIEVVIVILAIIAARKEPDEYYPLGRKNLESFARAGIGFLLCVAAVNFAGHSLAGLLSHVPAWDRSVREALPFLPAHEPLRTGGDVVGWVIGVTLVSAALSFVVSHHEIAVGKAYNHPSMVADGEETRSDGMIESVIFLGVCSTYLLGSSLPEYVGGLVVVVLISRTGIELFLGGVRVLLQRSLGREVESALEDVCMKTHGVRSVEEIVTFAVGSQAICNMQVRTTAPSRAHDGIKRALKQRMGERLAALGHPDACFYIRFVRASAPCAREVYLAAISEGVAVVTPSLETATHLIVADLDDGEDDRWYAEPLPSKDPRAFAELVKAKRTRIVRVFAKEPPEHHDGIIYRTVPSYSLAVLGLRAS